MGFWGKNLHVLEDSASCDIEQMIINFYDMKLHYID